VNSTVTVTELSQRAEASAGRLSEVAYRGVVLATAAMLLRNAVILGLLAPPALLGSAAPLALMLGGAVAAAMVRRDPLAPRRDSRERRGAGESTEGAAAGAAAPLPPETTETRAAVRATEALLPALHSPFSLTAALRFGLIFLALHVVGTLAQRALGDFGFYAVSVAGGLVSSASAVASAANLAAKGEILPAVAGLGAILASVTSALVTLPIVSRLTRDRRLTRRVALVLGAVALLGALGVAVQGFLPVERVRSEWLPAV
jgi:uncharacterized membrane protein (DUF4010 family)